MKEWVEVLSDASVAFGVPESEIANRLIMLQDLGYVIAPIELLENLEAAVLDEGQNRAQHRAVMLRTQRQWPTLWRSVEALVGWMGTRR